MTKDNLPKNLSKKTNKKQAIRKATAFISLLLLPIILNYLSPYLIIASAMEGIINGSFIVFGILFISSLFIGRFWCGWLCPGSGMGEVCATVNKKPVKGGKRDLIKWIFIWLPWIALITMFAIIAGGYVGINFLWNPGYAPGDKMDVISVTGPEQYVIYYGIIALFMIMNLAGGKRSFCHYACWMAPFMIIGTKIKNTFKYPSYHIEAETSKCRHCKRCNKECPMSLDVERMVRKKGYVDSVECISCGSCVANCPTGTLKTAWKWTKK